MGAEVNLIENYPRSKRNVDERGLEKTESDRAIARRFDEAFFDGDRKYGYGGFNYHPRFWEPVIPTFMKYYDLQEDAKILDVGCAKGFMLYDFKRLHPKLNVRGIDISEYAINNSKEEVREYLDVGCASSLPYEDNSFDLVISTTSIHNLPKGLCAKALQEVERVAKGKSFVTLDAYRNDDEKKRMEAWNLTAKTYMHVDEWKKFFDQIGYTGDYYWFIP